jgi:uncharacterized protein (TIGR02569 family)
VSEPPPPEVLAAFGLSGPVRRLDGGQGRSWHAGDAVLKPVDEEPEHAWVCEVTAGWTSREVDVPRPLRAAGGWVVDGWGAQARVPGATAAVADDPDWFRAVHVAFHRAVAHLPRPGFLDARDDPWAYGDRVAWEGAEPVGSAKTRALQRRALEQLEPVDLSSQVVHGDPAGNVLRDGDRATVIDWPPYWRPSGWALAVSACDAITWDGAAPSLLERWSDEPAWSQLLLRAVVYRLATRGRNEQRDSLPAGDEEFLERTAWMLDLVERA